MAKRVSAKTDPAKRRVLPKGLERALADRKPGVDSEALLNDLVEIWGGPRQLAIDIHAEFQATKPAAQGRQRILEMIQRLVINNTANGLGSARAPSDMTDDELDAVALQYVGRVTGDGTASPAA